MEKELRTIIEMSHDGIVILDDECHIRFANSNTSELTGYPPERLVGMDFMLLFNTANKKELAEILAEDNNEEKLRCCFGLEVTTVKGESKETEICITKARDEKGMRKTYVYLRDIYEKKISEEKLKKTEEEYRLLFERVQQGLFMSTTEDRLVGCNQAFLDILGYEGKDEILSLNITKDLYSTPEDRKVIQDLLATKGFLKDYEVDLKKKNKQKVTVLLTANIKKDDKKDIIGYEGIITDINDRKKIENELRKTNEFLKKLIDSSVDGIIAGDIKGNILIFNDGAEKLLGYKADEVIGKLHITEIYPPGIAKKIMRKLRSPKFGGVGKLETSHSTLIGKNGEHIPINISAVIIYEGEKEIASVGIFTDLREKMKMEKELQTAQLQLLQSEKMSSLGKLAAGVAHEINNPLGGILIYSNLLMEEMEEKDSKRDDLRKIAEEATRCKDIVKSLLEFARQTERKMEPMDINRAINEGLFFLENQAAFHNIEIVKKLDKKLPLIEGNASQLKQVFMNVIVNAAEAMDGRGSLTVKTAFQKEINLVLIKFLDTGKGILPEHVSKIFDPFFTTKEVGKGTGLGLSLSYGVIKEHNGSIDVECKEGKGTCFIIKLPLRNKYSESENRILEQVGHQR